METAEQSLSEKDRRDLVESGATVVANLKLDKELIAWAKKARRFVRICRPTKWGNPYVIGKDGDRDKVLNTYRHYLASNNDLVGKIEELRGKVLGCWCHPEACHGDELIKVLKEQS